MFDFDESQFEFGASKGNIQFKDLILKPSKINQILKEKESPFMLKAGRISLVNVKVSLLTALTPLGLRVESPLRLFFSHR